MLTNGNIVNKAPVPPLVKVREVAKLLSVSRHTVHHLIESGDLLANSVTPSKRKRGKRASGVKPRMHVRVTRDSLLKFYKDRFGHPLHRALANPFES